MKKVYASKPLRSTSLSFSIKLDNLNWFVLKKLKRGAPCDCPSLAHGSEITALVHAAWMAFRAALNKPNTITKTGVTCDNECNIEDGHFVFCVSTSVSFTHLRKVISIAFKAFKASFTQYSHCIRTLNGRPNREEYMHCLDQFNKASLDVFILTKKTPTSDQMGKLAKDRSVAAVSGKKSKPASLDEPKGKSEYLSVPVNGETACLVARLLTAKGLTCEVADKVVLVYNRNADDAVKRAMSSDSKKEFMSPLAKTKDAVAAVLAMSALSPVSSLDKLSKKALSAVTSMM
jgi:hypothetical protein